MLIRAYKVILVLLVLAKSGFSQRTETVVNFDNARNHFYLEVENDAFTQSDHYYTGGLAIFYTHRRLKHTPAQIITKKGRRKHATFSGFGIEHRLFTPYKITDPYGLPYDRPYSSYLMFTNFSVLVNPDKNLKFSNEIGLGILGPSAGGEQFQKWVHKVTNSTMPIGWESQLSNSFLIDYQIRLEKGVFGPYISRFLRPVVAARVGTLRDEIVGGLKLMLGNVNMYQAMEEVLGRSNDNKLIWEIVIEADIAGVLYDATLQGGMGNVGEPGTLSMQEVYARQYRIRAGINVYYQRFFLRYMLNYNSRDFTNAHVHHYGGINIGFSF